MIKFLTKSYTTCLSDPSGGKFTVAKWMLEKHIKIRQFALLSYNNFVFKQYFTWNIVLLLQIRPIQVNSFIVETLVDKSASLCNEKLICKSNKFSFVSANISLSS